MQFCPHLKPLIIPHLKNIDKIFALSFTQKDDITAKLNINSEKIFISGNGYNNKIFYPDIPSRRKAGNIVYAGKISNAKGLKELFAALKTVYESYKNFHLTIIL